MSSTNSPRYAKEKPAAYERFIGLETVRDITAQDTGTKQPLAKLSNGHIDGLGQIVRSPGMDRIQSATNVVRTKHLDLFNLTWVEKSSRGFDLKSSAGHEGFIPWSPSNVPAIAPFNGNLIYMGGGEIPAIYNGAIFETFPGDHPMSRRLRPAFGCTVQERFAVAGMGQYPGVVEISRVNDLNYFSDEEPEENEAVTRGGRIDVRSLIGRRESITGLCAYETNKLIIFTGSRGLVYRISTDIDEWSLEDKTAITTGCISHATICEAGQDVIYCSRTGVYLVARSRENGLMVASAALSDNIALLYRSLVRSVPDARLINAVWDNDESQYHIFFPRSDRLSYRLTLTVDQNSPLTTSRWALAEEEFLPSCGDFFEGSLVFGSSDGLYQVGLIEEEGREFTPKLIFETPNLYLGSFTDEKALTGMIVSASGNADALFEFINVDTGKTFHSVRVRVDPESVPGLFAGRPLTKQRRIPLNMRTLTFRLRVTAEGTGIFRLAGFAFIVGS